jgi:hypothetical protein
MGKLSFLRITILSFIGLDSLALAQNMGLILGSGSGTPGRSVVLPIAIVSTDGAAVAGIQWTFSYSTDITGVTVAIGTAGIDAHKSLSCYENRCLIIGFNRTTIPDGIVAIATFQIASHPSSATIPIYITGVVVASPEGRSISANTFSGTVSMPEVSSQLDRRTTVKGSDNTARFTK